MPNLIDYSFLSAREGGIRLDGYVPAPAGSKSGVTIATGCDLGQRNRADLRALRLPLSLIDKLAPYLGVTRSDAVKLLNEKPLRISLLEAQLIDKAVKRDHLAKLVERYINSDHNVRKVDFFSLPAEAQTVIASLSFQYGTLSVKTPRFWKAATSQDWAAVERELRNFQDRHPTRRHLEADLLARMKNQTAAEIVQ